MPLIYDGLKLADVGYRLDILVDGVLIVEVKALEAIAPVHRAQLLSYLRLSDRRLGLLLNFNVAYLKDGIARVVNKLSWLAPAEKDKRHGATSAKKTPRTRRLHDDLVADLCVRGVLAFAVS